MGKLYPLDWSHEARFGFENRLIIGVDEVGRGPLAGPVVAAAVVMPRVETLPFRLTDSKKLSAKQRTIAEGWIKTHCAWALGAASAREIDQINIAQATFLAMRRALSKFDPSNHYALIDGNRTPNELTLPSATLVKGDSLSPSIAAASILAKIVRDRAMTSLALRYPAFGWERNAAYPTAQHRDALARLGPTRHHRYCYAPVALAAEQAQAARSEAIRT